MEDLQAQEHFTEIVVHLHAEEEEVNDSVRAFSVSNHFFWQIHFVHLCT